MIKDVLREISPPFVWKAAHRLSLAMGGKTAAAETPWGFAGDFPSFSEALAASQGYQSTSLVASTLERARALQARLASGESADIDGNALHVFGALLPVVIENPKSLLRVLDVGGGLGSYYRFAKRFAGLACDWTVVETPAMAGAGGEFAHDRLRFVADAEQARVHGPFDVVLMSGVLQVMENPYAALDLYARMGAYTLIARTPLVQSNSDRLTVFNVPLATFGSPQSFPFWFFAEAKFTDALSALGTIRMAWISKAEILNLDGVSVPHRGFLLDARRKA